MEDFFSQRFNDWGDKIIAYRFPRWEELPEIDFYMDQIITFTEKRLAVFQSEESGKLITPSIINNYVKLKIIPPPIKKRYSRTHIAYLLMICCLKTVMPNPSIQHLIEYRLKSESLPAVYDSFCGELEASSRAAIERTNREHDAILSDVGESEKALGILTVRMAVSANADKLIAERLTAINRKPAAETDKKTL